MSMIQVRCKDCGSEVSMMCFNVLEDLEHVPQLRATYEDLRARIRRDETSFDSWVEQQEAQGAVTYSVDEEGDSLMHINGYPVPDESQRWEDGGRKCPSCGSSNTDWF